MSTHAPQGRLNLYEIVNYDRRESLIAVVAEGLVPLMSRLASSRPEAIAHWHSKEAFAVNQLAGAMPADDVEAFLKTYLANFRWHGWKMLVWRG